jgi:hypothetical protein
MADRQDIDALIVGALYGEIDADERARLDAHLSSHPEDRAALEGLQRTRAEVRRGMAEMPTQEPSPLVSNVLMAAAREAASAGAKGAVEVPTQGLWSRFVEWMRPIAGHPAFAAAAVLVLVAGTASALWMRDKGKATEPEVARHTNAEQATATAPGAGASDEKRDEADGLTAGDGYAVLDQGAAATSGSGSGSSARETKDAPVMERTAPSKGTAVATGKPARKKASNDPGMMQLEVRPDEVSIKELEEANQPDFDDGDADKSDGRGAGTKATGTAGVAKAPKPEPTPADAALQEWAAGKHTQLAKLVADGKCPEAGRLGAEIKDRAPEYYAANIANDRAIRACKSYIEGQAKKKADKDYKSRAQTNSVDDESPASD